MGLVLERKLGQSVHILFDEKMSVAELEELVRNGITVTVTDINRKGTKARLGIDAPSAVIVLREELLERERQSPYEITESSD